MWNHHIDVKVRRKRRFDFIVMTVVLCLFFTVVLFLAGLGT